MSVHTHDERLARFPDPRHKTFIEDMKKAGIPVRIYEPRGAYGKERPAAQTSDEVDDQGIIRATTLRLNRDSMGRGHVLYP